MTTRSQPRPSPAERAPVAVGRAERRQLSSEHPLPEASTRERLVQAMGRALQQRGLHGVGLSELLEQAQAPKGVMYHHFPGGKTELALAAIDAAVQQLCGAIDRAMHDQTDVATALEAWLRGAEARLSRSGFALGCPLAAVALESGIADTALRSALATGFAALRERLAALLGTAGLSAARANGLATLVLAAYEGALIQSRVAGDAAPMRATAEVLIAMVRAECAGSGVRVPKLSAQQAVAPAKKADAKARPSPSTKTSIRHG